MSAAAGGDVPADVPAGVPVIRIAGRVLTGAVRQGMDALVFLDSQQSRRIPIASVEFIDRVATKESMIGLVFHEMTAADAQVYQELCKVGDEIEVTTTAAHPSVRSCPPQTI